MKFLIFMLICSLSFGKEPVSGNRYELLSGIRKDKKSKAFLSSNRKSSRFIQGKAPAKFLAQNYQYIPEESKVLDINMKEGRNAVFLASKGYKVTGVSNQAVDIRKARMLAREYGIRIETISSTVSNLDLEKGSVDAIISFYYVNPLMKIKFKEWLKPGGILIFEAFTDLEKEKGQVLTIEESSLLKEFNDFRVLKYEEPLHNKNFTASIILKKI